MLRWPALLMAPCALVWPLVASGQTLPSVPAELRIVNATPVDHVVWRDFSEERALQPVTLVAPRGGLGLGQLVVTKAAGLADLKITLGALTTENGKAFPAEAVTVRFGAAATDERLRDWHKFTYLPVLAEKAPKAPLVPLWLIAQVPAAAEPGTYRGKLTVQAGTRLDVDVELIVSPWSWPKAEDRLTRFDVYQSPDAVAATYGVVAWSARHWELVERSLKLTAQVGSRVLWVPLISSGTQGLKESMVRYERTGNTWRADTSRLDKYLELAEKAGIAPDSIMFYVWHPGADIHPRKQPDPAKVGAFTITMLDGKNASLQNFTPEAEAFFATAMQAARASVLKRKWAEEAIMLGAAMDVRPSSLFVDQMKKAAPYATWVLHAHDQARELSGVKVGYAAVVRPQADWNGAGWANPRLLVEYPYDEGPRQGPARNHSVVAYAVVERKRGVGRALADFWGANMWVGGQPTMMNFGSFIFVPGKDGAEHSVASLMYLDGLQHAEAAARIGRGMRAKKLTEDEEKKVWALAQQQLGPAHAAQKHSRHDWPGIYKTYRGDDYVKRAVSLYEAAATWEQVK